MRLLILAALLIAAPAVAQTVDRNPPILVKTQPPGTANNTAASTAFVATAIGSGGPSVTTGRTVLFPAPNPTTFTSLRAIAGQPQPDGVAFDPNGAYIERCSNGGCFDGPHMFAANMMNVTSRMDATAQEQGFTLSFVSKTGENKLWKTGTAYTVGKQVRGTDASSCTASVGGTVLGPYYRCLYEVVTAGTSAASGTGPSGDGQSITDGTVVWKSLGPGDAAKTGFDVACSMQPGAAATWCNNFNFSVASGIGEGIAYGEEKDCNNGNEDSYAGSRFAMSCTFYGGGGAGNFPFFAYQYVGSGSVNSGGSNPYGAHNFVYISGNPGDTGSVVKDAVIADFGNSAFTVQAGAGRAHTAFLRDDSNSATILSATGTHTTGIDIGGSTINGGVALKMPTSTFLDWGDGGFMTWNGSIAAFTLGGTTSGTAYSLGVYNSGDVLVGRHLGQRGGSKPNLTGCGASTLTAASTDVSGIINIETGATACGLNFGAAYTTEADCVFSGSGGVPPAWGNSTAGYALSFSAAPSGLKISYVCMGQ